MNRLMARATAMPRPAQLARQTKEGSNEAGVLRAGNFGRRLCRCSGRTRTVPPRSLSERVPSDDLVEITLAYNFKGMAMLAEIVVAALGLNEGNRLGMLRQTFTQLGVRKANATEPRSSCPCALPGARG